LIRWQVNAKILKIGQSDCSSNSGGKMTDLMFKYYLFANPTLLSEVGRVMDLGATLNEYNSSVTPELADFFAISSDWGSVGLDIQSAMDEHVQENK